jgi:AraC-like DNA-binding protein
MRPRSPKGQLSRQLYQVMTSTISQRNPKRGHSFGSSLIIHMLSTEYGCAKRRPARSGRFHPKAPWLLRRLLFIALLYRHLLRTNSPRSALSFEFTIEYERFGHNLVHPPTPRERLLREIRLEVLASTHRGLPTIREIAERRGMSRTRFAHYFKETTGQTPASFITHVRINEAARLLLSSDLKLVAIAKLTGFADATHLCRVFLHHFYLTPDSYRRMTR